MGFLNKKKQDCIQIKAFYTVEASFVIPVALLVIAFIIQISFYMYARCIAVQDSYLIAFIGSIANDDNAKNDFMHSYAEAVITDKYFGNTLPTFSVTEEGKKINTTIESDTYHNAVDMLAPWLTGSWHIKACGSAEILERSKGIRRMSRLEDIARNVVK